MLTAAQYEVEARCSDYEDFAKPPTREKGPDGTSILVMHESMWDISDWSRRAIALRNHMLIALPLSRYETEFFSY